MSAFDKLKELKEALVGDDHKEEPVPAGQSKSQDEVRAEINQEEHEMKKAQEKEGWSDKIKGVLDGGEAKRKREEEEERLRIEKEHAQAKENVETERGITGKLQDAFDGGKHRKEMEEAEFQRLEAEAKAAQREHGLVNHIKDALGSPDELEAKTMEINQKHREKAKQEEEESGHHLTDKIQDTLQRLSPKPTPPPEPEHFSDKVKNLWEQATPGEKDRQEIHAKEREETEEGFKAKLHSKFHGQEPPAKNRGWLAEKLNEMAGGGAKSEADEDKLDKIIDFYQEHILKQGDQHNESAIEQLKDEQISDGLRRAYNAVTGHELPVKDKPH
ncbi:hypothetical protein OE88DRAFT_1663924 [Heliocybe sulcata]|uniref:Uncharacterized protein n=1 Tax=Heliocybe sulcata TaxID=5364 RepID=A0A5C3MV10_9AGAM|nr:hypothetical protein OE88DRAFT_1663924 [Heliocybe sulcata]